MLGRPGCDFSFSGLKTAVAQLVAGHEGALPLGLAADLAYSFQDAVVAVMEDRVRNAMGMMPEARLLVVAGGVAANSLLRSRLGALAEALGWGMVAPPLRLCGDNAVMVGWAAIERLRAGVAMGLAVAPRPRWGLGEI